MKPIVEGTAWLILQDIGSFTHLTETFEQQGAAGAERLGGMLRSFFRNAEAILLPYGGRMVLLVGDAYWALLPSSLSRDRIQEIVERLLHLPLFDQTPLVSRVVAVRGPARLERLPTSEGPSWSLKGYGVDVAQKLEERLAAGRAEIREVMTSRPMHLPDPLPFSLSHEPLRFLELHVAFAMVPEHAADDAWVQWLQDHGIYLAKWIPAPRHHLALLVAGYPYASGMEEDRMHRALLGGRHRGWIRRSGVARGRVLVGRIRGKTFEEIMFFGDPLNVASRLLQQAQSGDVLLGYHPSRFWKIRAMGSSILRGRRRPVTVDALVAHSREAEKVLPFTGREEEQQKLRDLLAQNRIVAVVGPAGVGKTRLVEETLRHGGWPVLWIRGTVSRAPLTAMRALIRGLPSPPQILVEYLQAARPIPWDTIYPALKTWLEAQDPRVLVLDHFHGLDRVSLQILDRMIPELIRKFPVVITARSHHALLKTWHARTLPLAPLSPSVLKDLLDVVAPTLSRKVREDLLRTCSGNLFCFQVLLAEWMEGRRLPPGVSLHYARMLHLSRRAQRMVELLACAGVPLAENELPDLPDDVIRELVDSSLVRLTEEGWEIPEESAIHNIRETIPPARQRRHYHTLAERAIHTGRDPQQIAMWYTRARAFQQAVHHWIRALDLRYYQGLRDEVQQMIREVRKEGGRFQTLSRLLEARWTLREGNYDRAERMLKPLLRKKTLRKAALFSLAELYDWTEQYETMKGCLVPLAAYRHTMSPSELVRFRELLGILHDMQGREARAVYWYQTCLELADRHHLEREKADAWFNLGWIHQKQEHWEKAREHYLNALMDGEDMYSRAATLLRLGDVAFATGNLDTAISLYRESLEMFRTLRFSFWERIARFALARAEAFAGMRSAAYQHALEAERAGTSHVPMTLVVALILGDEKNVRALLPKLPRKERFFRMLGEMLLGNLPCRMEGLDQLYYWRRVVAERVLEHCEKRFS